MAETFRISKVVKYLEKLRALRKVEFMHALMFSKHLREQFKEIFTNNEPHTLIDIHNTIDTITEYSYKKDGISFSHSQFSFLKETMFHLGGTHLIDNTIKEMSEFFNLDISEKSDLENYNIKSVDTKDYSNIPMEFYIIVGGMSKSFSKQVKEESTQHCLNILLEILEENEISIKENGFLIRTQLQNIPNISNELIKNNIGIYGIIPIKEK